jgi:hypothetical protein
MITAAGHLENVINRRRPTETAGEPNRAHRFAGEQHGPVPEILRILVRPPVTRHENRLLDR